MPWRGVGNNVVKDIDFFEDGTQTFYSMTIYPLGTIVYTNGYTPSLQCPPGWEKNANSGVCEAIDCGQKLYTIDDELNE